MIDFEKALVTLAEAQIRFVISEPVELFGRTFAVLTLDALIALKRAAGRPKDLLVLPEFEALREAPEE